VLLNIVQTFELITQKKFELMLVTLYSTDNCVPFSAI